jgi:long-chain acyl-CoA synthetase
MKNAPSLEIETNLASRVAVGDVLRARARSLPGHEAVVQYSGSERVSISYEALNLRVNRLVHALRAQGVDQGDRIALMAQSGIDFITVMFAAFKAGLVFLPVNFAQGTAGIRYCIEHADAKLVVFDQGASASLVACLEQGSLPKRIALDDDCEDGTPTLAALLQEAPDDEILDVVIAPQDIAQIMYTSGTTAEPKGVVHTHISLYTALTTSLLDCGFKPGCRNYTTLPLFHIAAEIQTLAALFLGGVTALQRRFDASLLFAQLERERATNLTLLPVMYGEFLKVTRDPGAILPELQAVIAANVAPAVRAQLRQIMPNAQLYGMAGQTEVCGFAESINTQSEVEHPGTNYWGTPSLGLERVILDDDGNELTQGQVGEICWRGPQVMAGYLDDSVASRSACRFGWHHSGDLGVIDKYGQLQFVDRQKDMIKSGGENVSSALVESTIVRMPGVLGLAVIGLPHPRWQEAVTALVVSDPGVALCEAAVIDHCKEHLGGFQVPKRVLFVDELPVNATGKIRKPELRQKYCDLYRE